MCDEHTHEWVPFQSHAEGFFSKRPNETGENQELSVQWYTGRVLSCVHQPCQTYLFIPDGPYSPVECEMAAETEAVAA